MDVSNSAGPSPAQRVPARPATPSDLSGVKAPVPRRLSPLRFGVVMGILATLSAALIICCVVSVAGRLGPGRRYLNRGITGVSIATGLFVGFRSWQKRREDPFITGSGTYCPDCARPLLIGETVCPVCGRPVSNPSSSQSDSQQPPPMA